MAILAGCRAAPTAPDAELSEAGHVSVEIASASGTHRFYAERAATPEARASGLKRRAALAPNEAMFFAFPAPKIASFWMEETAIPIDMIFVRADGTIARIAADNEPLSREPVSSLEEVIAVLEVAGGRARELGFRVGDRVTWPGGPRLNGGPGSR